MIGFNILEMPLLSKLFINSMQVQPKPRVLFPDYSPEKKIISSFYMMFIAIMFITVENDRL